MIVKEDFLKKIRSAFDLNIYEAKIWTALLSKGVATAGELSDISNVPRSRSYDVLESLEKRGFVIMKLGKPIKYIAVEPNEVVKRVKKALSERTDYHIKMLFDVSKTEIFKDLNLLFKNGINKVDPTSITGSIKGRNNIYDQIETLFNNAKESITLVTTDKGLERKGEIFFETIKKVSKKGVKIRIATQVDPSEEILNKLAPYIEIKTIPDLNARFVIVDNKELLFMLCDDKTVHESYDTAIWITSSFFVNAFGSLFEESWNKLSKLIPNQ